MKNGLPITKLAKTPEKSIKSLVGNRTAFTLNNCELNIFETFQKTESLIVKTKDLTISTMISGKKEISVFDKPQFDYLPGHSILYPQNTLVKFNFPTASLNEPTQSVAISIDKKLILDTLNFLNENYPKKEINNYWSLDYENFLLYNNEHITESINKLLKEGMSNSITKDVIVELTLKELIIRIIQLQNSKKNDDYKQNNSNNCSEIVLKYIRENLQEDIDIDDLCDISCMTKSTFYRYFKKNIGMSPSEYIQYEKIKNAKKILINSDLNIKEVSFSIGFDDPNYFNRVFKKIEGITPKQFQSLNYYNKKKL